MDKSEVDRVCIDCGHRKPLIQFNKDKTKRFGRRYYCKDCQSERGKLYVVPVHTSEFKRARYVMQTHGITLQEYDMMMSRSCEICGEESSHLDHDHVTGKLRGVLCHKCNVGIGHFNDDPARLHVAAVYIEKSLMPLSIRPVQ